MSVFPNPAAGPVSVRLVLPEARCIRLRLYDGLGRLVVVPLAPTPYPSGSTTFVLSSLPRLAAGLYFLVLDADNQRLATTQLVIVTE
ncbi:T9SS type A sorting domain-containing protein [Hymenobacter siberiensis]|jgi:hypothetical protein